MDLRSPTSLKEVLLVIRDHVIRDQTLDRKKKVQEIWVPFLEIFGSSESRISLNKIGLQGAVRAVFF